MCHESDLLQTRRDFLSACTALNGCPMMAGAPAWIRHSALGKMGVLGVIDEFPVSFVRGRQAAIRNAIVRHHARSGGLVRTRQAPSSGGPGRRGHNVVPA